MMILTISIYIVNVYIFYTLSQSLQSLTSTDPRMHGNLERREYVAKFPQNLVR
jgi:hypothetical protein